MAKKKRQNFAGMELLPTSMLEKIIEQDANQEADYDQDLIDYVLELMLKRAKEENPNSIPNIQSSWNKLQKRLGNTAVLEPLSKASVSARESGKSPLPRRILRYVAFVTACIMLLVGAMFTVQATGVDIFGAFATWTDSIFQFSSSTDTDVKTVNTAISPALAESDLAQALSDIGLSPSLAPTWIPEEYTLSHIEKSQIIGLNAVCATYILPNSEKPLVLDFELFYDPILFSGKTFQKSSSDPQVYVRNGRQFYLFENYGIWVATWSDTRSAITIYGANSKETILSIIDSISEVSHE